MVKVPFISKLPDMTISSLVVPSVPVLFRVRLLKSLPAPVPPVVIVCCVVPLKVTVPELAVKVPELAQLPETVNEAVEEACKMPLLVIVTLLAEEAVS
jgi:hypothetical protein